MPTGSIRWGDRYVIEVVSLERELGLLELGDRISALWERSLEAIDLEILQLLERSVVLTPRELEHLEGIEGRS
ncbi:MAG: hypothetical protein SWY16_13790 [Cyanobacteriota bacterium]|nr:hypothetical protein [Cyanobacteriota bacterium]